MKLWKRLTAAVTACSMMLGAAAVQKRFVPEEQVLAATSSETLSYTESGKVNDEYNTYSSMSWDAKIQYTIITESDWDESVGSVVDTKYIVLDDITIQVDIIPPATAPAPDYYSDTVGGMYGASHFDGSASNGSYSGNIVIEIPEKIDGISVKKMSSMEISTDLWSSYGANFYGAVELILPDTLTAIGGLTSDSSYGVETYINYNGTCKDFFSKSSSVSTMPVICTDCLLFCEQITGGYREADTITYDGTMAQWKAIRPSSLSEVKTICSDGTLNKPLPTSDNYTFSRESMSACLIGNLSEDTVTLTIPEEIEGYAVTSVRSSACTGLSKLEWVSIPDSMITIGDEAFLNCRNLLNIAIPSSVTKIGDYAFGYWENSDGSYSRMSTVTIYCDAGSAAEQYAIDNGFHYVTGQSVVTTEATTTTTMETTTTMMTTTNIVPTTTRMTTTIPYIPPTSATELTTSTTTIMQPILFGDVNLDGVVDILDADLVEEEYERIARGLESTFTDAQKIAADMNADGKITHMDAYLIRQKAGYVETTLTSATTTTTTTTTVDGSTMYLKVGEVANILFDKDGCTYTSANVTIAAVSANGVVIGVSEGDTYVIVEDSAGQVKTIKVIVSNTVQTTVLPLIVPDTLYGDVTLDGKIDLTDAIMLNKYCADVVSLSEQAIANGDCNENGQTDTNDSIALLRFLVHLISALPSAE